MSMAFYSNELPLPVLAAACPALWQPMSLRQGPKVWQPLKWLWEHCTRTKVVLAGGAIVAVASAAALAAAHTRPGRYVLSVLGECAATAGWSITPHAHGVVSWLLKRGGTPAKLAQPIVRCTFTGAPIAKTQVHVGHTHGSSAAARSSASALADHVARELGYTAYYCQLSASDKRHNRAGCRTYHWAKDFGVDPSQYTEMPEASMPVLIDVDFYVDMPRFLNQTFSPVFIYTVQPEAVAAATGEYAFSFSPDNVMTYAVSGGAVYEHQVWNYGSDQLVTSGWNGLTFTVSCYLIDRRAVAPHHPVVFLTPLVRWTNAYAVLAFWWLSKDRLRRLTPVTTNSSGSWAQLRLTSPDGLLVSTGKASSFACATVMASEHDTIAALARTTASELTIGAVASVAQKASRSEHIVLMEFFRAKFPCNPPTVTIVKSSLRDYTFTSVARYNGPEKVPMVAFMQPLYGPCYVATRSAANEEVTIQGRVEKIVSSVEADPVVLAAMHDFVELLGPSGRLHPVSTDTVFEKQHRPTQHRALLNADQCLQKDVVPAFQKAESYVEPKEPRNISNFQGPEKMEYSQFMYALSEHLKTFQWFACGMNPRQIATRVAEYLTGAEFAVLTDLSRLDGRVSPAARTLEKLTCMRLFNSVYHATLIELMRSQVHQTGVTSHGLIYNTGTSRLSGSPETSVFNTLLNCFMMFLAYRMTNVAGKFIDPRSAFAMLGAYLGDDGASKNVDPKAVAKAAAALGQVAKVEVVHAHQPGVKFLSRVYGPDVFSGDSNTCTDIVRTMSKFHVSQNLDQRFTPKVKLYLKAVAFLLTDSETPYLGPFCQKVTALAVVDGLSDVECKDLTGWWSHFDREVQWPNVKQDWMLHYVETSLEHMDFAKFLQAVDKCVVIADALAFPQCFDLSIHNPPTGPYRAIVQGDPVDEHKPPAPEPREAGKAAAAKKSASKPRSAAAEAASVKTHTTVDASGKPDQGSTAGGKPSKGQAAFAKRKASRGGRH